MERRYNCTPVYPGQFSLVPPEESARLYAHAREPKRLVVRKGYGHYEVDTEPAIGRSWRPRRSGILGIYRQASGETGVRSRMHEDMWRPVARWSCMPQW